MKKKLAKILALLLAAVFVLSSCGTTTSTEGNSAAPDNSNTEPGTSSAEPITVTNYMTAELNSLDPTLSTDRASMEIIRYVYSGLYKLGTNGSIVLDMASDVDVSDDGLTWTFTIRDDAYWSNGDPVTAYDFEYSWKRLANPETGASYAYMLITAQIENAADVCFNGADIDTLGVEAPDASTLIVHLTTPCSWLPSILRGSIFSPINQSYCEAEGDQFGLSLDHTIFNGIYCLTDWEVGGTYLKLEKNTDYYAADEVTTDVLQYRVITDSAQLIMAWESGEIDRAALSGENVELYQNDPAYRTATGDFVYYLSFNTKVAGLDNLNLRKAIALTVDNEAICTYILKDGSVPLYSLVPGGFAEDDNGQTFREAANASYLETDKAQAQECWEAAKAELGIDSIEFNLLYPEGSTYELIATEIQSELQSNLEGLTITLSVEPSTQLAEDRKSGNFEIAWASWGADYQDATTYLDLFLEDSTYNYGSWYNERYNELHDLIYGEYVNTADKRLAAMIEQEAILLDDAAICPIYQGVTSYLLTTDYEFPYSDASHGHLLQYATPVE